MANKTALVTGASYGLGPHIAMRLARDGFNVAVTARSAEPLEIVRSEIAKIGAKALAIPADVTDPDARASLIAKTEAQLGPIDVLVNNAGVALAGRFAMQMPADIETLIETNVTAPILLTRAVLPGMLARKSGHIVQLASLAGKVALPYFAAYSASKSALVGFTHSIQAELRGTGVHASVICPGFVKGDGMWARIKRRPHIALGESRPERVADAVANAIARGSLEILVNPRPVRPAIAMWAVMPKAADAAFQLLKINGFLRSVGEQIEKQTAQSS